MREDTRERIFSRFLPNNSNGSAPLREIYSYPVTVEVSFCFLWSSTRQSVCHFAAIEVWTGTRMPDRNYTCFEVYYKHFNWILREDVWLTSIVCWSVCSSGCLFEFGCLISPTPYFTEEFKNSRCDSVLHVITLYWFCVVLYYKLNALYHNPYCIVIYVQY